MKRIIQTIYLVWGGLCFATIFLVLFPFFVLVIEVKSLRGGALLLNRIWGTLTYWLLFTPPKKIYKAPLPSEPVIFVSNHASYLDIAIMGAILNRAFKFVGKSSLTKPPLFGYMFRNLHIPVNRQNAKHSYHSLELTKKALDEGNDIIIFPEGTINMKNVPSMLPFKDGAFKVAIEKQTPLVPLILPYNWIVMHDFQPVLVWHPCEVVFLPAIETKGLTLSDLDALKEKTYRVMIDELISYFPDNPVFADQLPKSTHST